MLQIVLLVLLSFLVVFVSRQIWLIGRGGIDIRSRRTGRLLAAVLLGSAFGVAAHLDYASKRSSGRQVFLERQAQRFDRYISKPHTFDVIGGILFIGAAVGAYELIAWA